MLVVVAVREEEKGRVEGWDRGRACGMRRVRGVDIMTPIEVQSDVLW